MDSASFSYLQLLMEMNTPRWSHCTRQLNPKTRNKWEQQNTASYFSYLEMVMDVNTQQGKQFEANERYYSSSLNSSGYMNPKIKHELEQQNTDSYFTYLEMVMNVNTQKGGHCTRQLKTKPAYCSSGLRSSGHRNSKTGNPETNPGKIPSLLDIVIPIGNNASPNVNTCKRQLKQKQRKCHSFSSKPEKENTKNVVSKLNKEQMALLCDPETPRSNADTLKQNETAKDLKLIHTDLRVQETDDTCIAVSQLKHSLTSEDRSTLGATTDTVGATTDQNITLCSGTVQSEQDALCEQDSQTFPAADTLLNDGNVPEQFATMSIESSSVNNDHPGNVNTEMAPGSYPLQQSQMLYGPAPRKSRMARFLWPIPFRSYLCIVDTNNHHDNGVNNDSSFRQWGDLPHDTHNDGSLPDSRSVSESIYSPVTQEAYSSKDDKFVWKWPPAPVPKSLTMEETGEDDNGAPLDPLPELEMTVSEFVEMIEDRYQEPVIAGIEEYVNVQRRAPCRIPSDICWMSLATDQITRPCCKTESLLMDVTRQLMDVSNTPVVFMASKTRLYSD